MSKQKIDKEETTPFWSKCKKWVAGAATVVGIIVVTLTQVIDFYKTRVVNANNFPQASSVREMTNKEVADFIRDEFREMRMLILFSKGINTDSLIEIKVKAQPSGEK